MIAQYQSNNPEFGYNKSSGGESNSGFHHSEETKKKMSEANKGKPTWCKGKHLSEEIRKKMSEAHKGEKHPLFGKHLSEETRKKKFEKIIREVKIILNLKKVSLFQKKVNEK